MSRPAYSEDVSLRLAGARQVPPYSQIPRRAAGEDPPLSFAQRRLWFLQRLEPGNPAYNMSFAYRVRGRLDAEALCMALETVAARHETLRTTFADRGDEPVQVIHAPGPVALPLTDLRLLPREERDAAMRRLALERASRPLTLAEEFPLRAELFRLDDQDHVLLLIIHHVASDAWSLGVLVSELGASYRGLVTGVPERLPDLPIQYADFSVWQRGRMRTDALRGELDYWKRQLGGAPPLLELPTDRPRPDHATHAGAELTVTMRDGLAGALSALSRRAGGTLFMALLAGFQLLLSRWSGQRDVVVGAPIAGRSHLEVEGLIGCFINTLVLRTSLAGNPTFAELLGRVRETAIQAYSHQELPFERLVEELRPERSLSYNPLFQVLFQLENTRRGSLSLHGLEVREVDLPGFAAKFDMTVRMQEQAGGLSCVCRYNAALFDGESIAHLLDQYQMLLEQAVAAPDAHVGAYSLRSPRARLLLPDPAEPLAAPVYPMVRALVSRLAREAADSVAVSRGSAQWTYAELDAAATALAGALRVRGVSTGSVVALSGPPSFGLIASMLATLACGGVMLPIAADLPDRRKRLMLRDGGATHLVLTGSGDRRPAWARGIGQLAFVPVGECAEVATAAAGTGERAPAPPRPEDAAYIFFTSGTTGTPKAVLGTHQGLNHFLSWQRTSFGIGADDRCAQLTGLSFDVVLRDVFLPLTSGASLCIPAGELPPDSVLEWLAAERITVLHSVPSLAGAWLEHARPCAVMPALRWIFLAGEPLTDALVRRWRQVVTSYCGLVNLYGPTEATMVKCCYRVPGEPIPGLQPAGGALPQSQMLVLSDEQRLCGVNEPGEIVIRTPFMTRGYLNAPEEQRRRFIPNPFGTEPSDLVYRTGDRGRYRHDGSLMVHGRLDHQIKIRGVRIEPSEVAAVLSGHPAVRAAAVIGRPLGSEPVALVAYVVPGPEKPQTAELRAYLAARLPAAMIPGAFVPLERLPLTPNGKLDVGALPSPEPVRAPAAADGGMPVSPVEQSMARIWEEVLQVGGVARHDDFFDLGGHSLLATRVVARCRTAFGVELPVRTIFEAPTLAAFAQVVARHLGPETAR